MRIPVALRFGTLKGKGRCSHIASERLDRNRSGGVMLVQATVLSGRHRSHDSCAQRHRFIRMSLARSSLAWVLVMSVSHRNRDFENSNATEMESRRKHNTAAVHYKTHPRGAHPHAGKGWSHLLSCNDVFDKLPSYISSDSLRLEASSCTSNQRTILTWGSESHAILSFSVLPLSIINYQIKMRKCQLNYLKVRHSTSLWIHNKQ